MKWSILLSLRSILVIILLCIGIGGFSQNDLLMLSSPPQNEFNFTFGIGKQSQIKYQIEKGENIFLPSRNHAWEASFDYARQAGIKTKYSIGFTFGAASLETPFEITNEQFPGIDQYIYHNYYSGNSAFLTQMYSDLYISIPFKFHYNFHSFNKIHRLWVNGGVGIQYLFQNYNSRSYLNRFDTSYIELVYLSYNSNPENKFNFRFSLGMEYRYQLPYYHELILGVNYDFHIKDMYTGNYTILQFDPSYSGKGTFTNRMNLLSLNVGYSFNNKRKRYKQYQHHKYKTKDELILPPDTMSNIFEIRFGTNPSIYAWNTFDSPNTFARFEPNNGKFQLGSYSIHYLKYKTDNWAFYTGIDADIGAYNFELAFNKKDYNFLLQDYNLKHQELITYLNIPFGYHRNINIGKKSDIELSAALVLSVCIPSDYSHGYYAYDIDSTILVFRTDYSETNYIMPGGQANIGYSYETKRKNKWIIGLRGSMNFIKTFTMEYQIINPDKSYTSGEIDMHPINIQVYWRYSFTGKRQRYLKSI